MIYKPTDLSPSAQTFDVMDTPIFFECKVDTSNVQASGFTIEILDSENNVVFSSIPKGEQLNINYITIIDDLREYVHTYFPDYETGYSLLNTGYNGSYLKFPFSVAYDSKADNTSAINQIFYIPQTQSLPNGVSRSDSGLYRNNYIWNGNNYIINTSEPLKSVNIFNGKEYKWSITLYQLENRGTSKNPVWMLPENPLMFDMPMTIGTVLGSNNKRIQSVFSEEIYSDYFIQPLWIEGLNYDVGEEDGWTYIDLDDSDTWSIDKTYTKNNYVKYTQNNTTRYYKYINPQNGNKNPNEDKSGEYWKKVEQITQIGDRVMIKSYDMSFGYIYPMDGDDGIPEGDIVPDEANAFRIYKRGNNQDNLTDYQKVSYVLETPLLGTIEWKVSLANAGESYYEQKWDGDIGSSGKYFPPGFPNGVDISANERIVLNGQDDKSKNGIYYPQFSSETLDAEPTYTNNYNIIGMSVNIELPSTFANKFQNDGNYTFTCDGNTWKEYNSDNIYACTTSQNTLTISDIGIKITYAQEDVLTNYSLWDSNETYSKNDYVYTESDGVRTYYRCEVDSTTASIEDTSSWQKLESAIGVIGDTISFTIKKQVVARWIRTPDADTWGELVNKIVMVTRAGSPYFGKNIQIIKDNLDPKDKTGTINETPFTFTEELPVDIYAYDYDSANPYRNNIGLIFYNNPIIKPNGAINFNQDAEYDVGDVVETESGYYRCIKLNNVGVPINNTEYWRELPKYEGNKNGILYIRYFEGIQKGMMLQKLSTNNKYNYFIIDDVGTNGGMYLKYHEVKEFDTYQNYDVGGDDENPSDLTADTTWEIDETKYQIKTYFRESDENAFYFYSRPEIDVQFENTKGVNFTSDRTPLLDAYEWEEGRIYGEGDYVYVDTVGGSTRTRTYYWCLKNNVKDIGPTASVENTVSADGCWLNIGTEGIRKYVYAEPYQSGKTYNIGDYVYYSLTNKYYMSLSGSNTSSPPNEGSNSNWVIVPLDINYKKDDIVKYNDVYYIALTNISQVGGQIEPARENLGIFWEPYVGVLFVEDIGFSYSLYSDLKVYDKGAVVYNNGRYYYAKQDIRSVQPPRMYNNESYYKTNDIVWMLNDNKDVLYYKAIRDIDKSTGYVDPPADGFWSIYDAFTDFIWQPYTNVQLIDESKSTEDNTVYIEYYRDNLVVYNGIMYKCNIIEGSSISTEEYVNEDGSVDVSAFMSAVLNGSAVWIKYEGQDGDDDEVFVNGIRYVGKGQNKTIYNEFNPEVMYLLDRVIYCDGIQYKVTKNVDVYDNSTIYSNGAYILYDKDADDGETIYEYYIYINQASSSGNPPMIENDDGNIVLNDEYWAKTIINTLPKINDANYYSSYSSWTNNKLYNHGDIVLYNDKFYVYINENSQKMGRYNNIMVYNSIGEQTYTDGDIVWYNDVGTGAYKWMLFYRHKENTPVPDVVNKYSSIVTYSKNNNDYVLYINNKGVYEFYKCVADSVKGVIPGHDVSEWELVISLCPIVPEEDEEGYPSDYDSSKYWVPYYGFMYYGDYEDGVSINRTYSYNNVTKLAGQYYIYVNPNITDYIGVTDDKITNSDVSLLRLNENIQEFKGEKKYNVGDIVLYNNKYYIYYNSAGDWLYSPANADYWTLFPWQVFVPQIHERTIVCCAEYKQQQYIQWKSAQWFLYEENGVDVLDKSDIMYDGNLKYTFHGVDGREKGTDKPVYFIVRLIIETRAGYRMTVERKIEAIYEIEEIDSEGLISAYFDCDTMSIITEVTKESGFIMPTISETGTTITYSEGTYENGLMSISGEVNYEKVLYSLESVSDIASAKDITSESERFEIMSSHTIDTDRFSGVITSLSSSVANAITEQVQQKGYFKIYLSELLKYDVNTYEDVDTQLAREDIIVVNNDRNVIMWEANDVNGQVPFTGVVEIRNTVNSNGKVIPKTEGLSEEGDISAFFVPGGYITCSNWQPLNFNYSQYEYSNYLPITYAACIMSSASITANNEVIGATVIGAPYRNVKRQLNLYEADPILLEFKEDGTVNNVGSTPCKRVQEPILSISRMLPEDNAASPNEFAATPFDVDGDNGGGENSIYVIGSVPTLCSDFAYKETYGVYEGKTNTGTYARKKNVMLDYSYAFTDETLEDGESPENNIWNNGSNIWSDGDYILNGSSILYDLGGIKVNDETISSKHLVNGEIVEDTSFINDDPVLNNEDIFSVSKLGWQETLKDNNGVEVDVISERKYLNGKTLILDAELMMDGDGGITPYPIGYNPSATPEKVVVYIDTELNFAPKQK